MKNKTIFICYTITAVCFLISAILTLVSGSFLSGVLNLAVTCSFVVLAGLAYRNWKDENEN